MELSPRLLQVAALVPRGAVVADIGTDHGHLPCYLVNKGIAPRVIAADINLRPYQIACGQVAKAGLGDRITVRMGDGLSIINPGEVTAAIIAGMGGSTISEILRQTPVVTESLSTFVLQPMTEVSRLRRWLAKHYFTIAQEALVVEDRRWYEVLQVNHGCEPNNRELLYTLGPRLVEKRHPLLLDRVTDLLTKEKAILAELIDRATNRPANWERIRQLKTRTVQLEEVKKWLLQSEG